ncbi:hypothetical protein OG288_15805 [Streptomyces tauricus]|uniref:Uncharacterized protein n=1 Tax=Streptomyces tauricus TaxID=68274 RepID=A0ABZ1JDF9_9ACTN|nr:hypothetical protein [Streptomyces tauricus]
MLSNAASPVFLAHVKSATDSFDDFKLVSALFKMLDLTGTFAVIDGIRCWVEGRTEAGPMRVLVPCEVPSDVEGFKDYLRVLADTPEDATDGFLSLVQNLGDVLDAVFSEKGWKRVHKTSWPGFFEAYLTHESVYAGPGGYLYEMWRA